MSVFYEGFARAAFHRYNGVDGKVCRRKEGRTMIKAIVYTSQTGYTAAYAALLADKTGVKAVSLEEAVSAVPEQSEILYLGWLMAGKVQGYDKARKIYRVSALCGVGMGRTGTQLDDIRRQNGVPEAMPVFSLQGGFDRTRLRGL